jgi:hypothetical protein
LPLSPDNAKKYINEYIKNENSLGPFFSIAIPAYGYNGKGKDFLEEKFNYS